MPLNTSIPNFHPEQKKEWISTQLPLVSPSKMGEKSWELLMHLPLAKKVCPVLIRSLLMEFYK